ncbi:MAG TPA: phasin family protein [Alphaproteobacteria bacterium]|nr:phasin family protein [Alphaproteobacteria bacterium]
MTKQTQQTDSAWPGMQLPWMAGLNGSGMKNLSQATETCQRACAAWQQEIARFANARWQRDSEAAQRMLTSANWSEAMKVQQEWLTSAGQDYVDEMNRLMQLAQKVGSDVMQQPESRQAAE